MQKNVLNTSSQHPLLNYYNFKQLKDLLKKISVVNCKRAILLVQVQITQLIDDLISKNFKPTKKLINIFFLQWMDFFLKPIKTTRNTPNLTYYLWYFDIYVLHQFILTGKLRDQWLIFFNRIVNVEYVRTKSPTLARHGIENGLKKIQTTPPNRLTLRMEPQ